MGNMRNMQGMPNMAGGHHRPSHMGPGGQPLLGPNMQQMPGQMQQMSGQMQQMPGQMQQMPGQMQQMPGQMQQMPGQMQQMQQMGGIPGQMGGQHAAAMAAAQQRNSPMSSVPQSPHMVPQSPLSQHGGMAPSPMSQHMSPHPGMSPATTHTPTHNPSSRDEFNLGKHFCLLTSDHPRNVVNLLRRDPL